jgi:hypothetical protein
VGCRRRAPVGHTWRTLTDKNVDEQGFGRPKAAVNAHAVNDSVCTLRVGATSET